MCEETEPAASNAQAPFCYERRYAMQTDAQVLNTAMDMVLEWGEDFGKAINDRLRQQYPDVSAAEAEAYDRLCRDIKSYGFRQVELAYTNKLSGEEATQNMLAKYPQLNQDTLGRIWSHGQYYAWRESGSTAT